MATHPWSTAGCCHICPGSISCTATSWWCAAGRQPDCQPAPALLRPGRYAPAPAQLLFLCLRHQRSQAGQACLWQVLCNRYYPLQLLSRTSFLQAPVQSTQPLCHLEMPALGLASDCSLLAVEGANEATDVGFPCRRWLSCNDSARPAPRAVWLEHCHPGIQPQIL